jgi:cysteinyl-tRNA synthetase
MSKSLGNVILLEDLLKNNKSNSIRLALLSAHYRQPLNWSDSTLIESNNLIKKFSSLARSFVGDINKYENLDNEIIDILSDDLNTPEAIKHLSELSKAAKTNQKDLASLIVSAKFIGINLLAHNISTLKAIDEELVKFLVEERFNARSSGDFKKADEIRDKLLSMRISIKDLEDKTVWDYNPDN